MAGQFGQIGEEERLNGLVEVIAIKDWHRRKEIKKTYAVGLGKAYFYFGATGRALPEYSSRRLGLLIGRLFPPRLFTRSLHHHSRICSLLFPKLSTRTGVNP